MGKVPHTPHLTQRTGDARGARAVRHRGSSKPLVVEAHWVAGGRSLGFQLSEPLWWFGSRRRPWRDVGVDD